MGHKCGLNGKFVSPKLQNPFTIRRGAAVVAVRRISHVAVVVHDNHAIGGRGRSTVGQADTHSLSRLFFKRSPLLACVRGMARRATEDSRRGRRGERRNTDRSEFVRSCRMVGSVPLRMSRSLARNFVLGFLF